MRSSYFRLNCEVIETKADDYMWRRRGVVQYKDKSMDRLSELALRPTRRGFYSEAGTYAYPEARPSPLAIVHGARTWSGSWHEFRELNPRRLRQWRPPAALVPVWLHGRTCRRVFLKFLWGVAGEDNSGEATRGPAQRLSEQSRPRCEPRHVLSVWS